MEASGWVCVRWCGLIPALDEMIVHLDDAADTLTLASETLDSVNELGNQLFGFNIEAGPAGCNQIFGSDVEAGQAGSTAGRQLLRDIHRGIGLSRHLVAALNDPQCRKYYTCDSFFAHYGPAGHLVEVKIRLEGLISCKPDDRGTLALAEAANESSHEDTFPAFEHTIQQVMYWLSHAITKMKIVSWYVTAFQNVISFEPTPKNCYFAGNHACDGAKITMRVREILKNLLDYLVSQPPVVRDSFGYGRPLSFTHVKGRITKIIEIPVTVFMRNHVQIVRYLCVLSGVKMELPHGMDVQPGSQAVLVDLSGMPDQISTAEQLLKDVLAEANAGISRNGLIIPVLSTTTEKYEIQIPTEKVHLIIGKHEETLRHIHIQSGAHLQIMDSQPVSKTTPVHISGTSDQRSKAEQMITDVLAEASVGIYREFSLSHAVDKCGRIAFSFVPNHIFQMQLANDKAVLLIGEGCETLKSLQAKSGARIQVVPLHVPHGFSTERTVYIDGTNEQIEFAKKLVNGVTSECGPHPDRWDPLECFLEEQLPD